MNARFLTVLVSIVLLFAGGCAQDSPPADSPAGSTPAAAGVDEPADSGAQIFRVTYTGFEGQSQDQLRQSALKAAADLARSQDQTHFAVIEEGTEAVLSSGPVSRVTGRMPIKRSNRRARSTPRGPLMSLELGQSAVPAYFLRVRLFSGEPPADARATFVADDFP